MSIEGPETLAETLDRDGWGKESNRGVFKSKMGIVRESIDKLKKNSFAFWYRLSDSKKCLF